MEKTHEPQRIESKYTQNKVTDAQIKLLQGNSALFGQDHGVLEERLKSKCTRDVMLGEDTTKAGDQLKKQGCLGKDQTALQKAQGGPAEQLNSRVSAPGDQDVDRKAEPRIVPGVVLDYQKVSIVHSKLQAQ